MRLRKTLACRGHPEIAVMRIGAQTIGFEILVAVMTDCDTLFRPGAFSGGNRTRLCL